MLRTRAKWLAMPVAAVAVGVGIGALTVRRRPAPKPQSRPATAAAHPEITVHGVVRAQHIVRVAAPVSGAVVALPVQAGQDVYQGEVLARVGEAGRESVRDAALQASERAQDEMSKAEAQIITARLGASRAAAGVEAAQIDWERVQKVYDRQKMLHDAGATPRLVYEKAEQDYQSSRQELAAAQNAAHAAKDAVTAAEAALADARKTLEERKTEAESAQLAFAAAEVRSPVDGFLSSSQAEMGKTVEADGPLFEIATGLDELEVAVEASPEVLRRIRPGQAAVVTVADVGGAGVAGAVREISGNLAIVEFHSADPAIKPGMQAAVRLKLE